jgi:hypothetical protein
MSHVYVPRAMLPQEYESILVAHLAADAKKRKLQFEKAKGSKAKIHDPAPFRLREEEVTTRFSEYIGKHGLQSVQ